YRDARGPDGRLGLGRKDPRFWPAVGVVLDVLHALGARVRETAEALGVSTANLIDFLASDPKVWEQANHLRTHFGHKPLRHSSREKRSDLMAADRTPLPRRLCG